MKCSHLVEFNVILYYYIRTLTLHTLVVIFSLTQLSLTNQMKTIFPIFFFHCVVEIYTYSVSVLVRISIKLQKMITNSNKYLKYY